MTIAKLLKLQCALAALVTSLAFGATLSPITLLNPAGSTSGQAIVSTGASSAPAWSNVTLSGLAAQAGNTVVANATGSSASPTAFAMPSCSAATSALTWTTSTGFTCNSAINAAMLGGATFAAPGPIGSTTRSSGSFTTLAANGVATLSGGASVTGGLTPDTLSVLTSGTSPTVGLGDNSTKIATTAFVANHEGCKNILDYGGNNGGSVDNSSAWSSAVSAATAGYVCVYFPPGTYNFASAISYTLPNTSSGIGIIGAGSQLTKLTFPSNSGITIVAPGGPGNSAHIRNLSIQGGTSATGVAISLVNTTNGASPVPDAMSDLTDVVIHGADGFAQTDYWSEGVWVQSWSNVNFNGVAIYGGGGGGSIAGYSGQGGGIYFVGSSGSGAPPQGVQYNISKSNLSYLNQGVIYNNWVQGISVSQTNFTGNSYGIYVNTPNQGQDQLTVTNSQFNCANVGIYDQIGVPGESFFGNYFLVPEPTSGSNAAIQYTSEWGGSIVGNTFQRIGSANTNTNGIVVGGKATGGGGLIISGNFFTGLNTGIYLNSSSTGNNVQSNSYTNNGSNIVDSGTSNTKGGGSQ